MGIQNHSSFNYNGITINDTYICISKNVIRVSYNKDSSLYSIEIPYLIYGSLNARNGDFPPLLNCQLSSDMQTLPSDLYAYCYQQIKNLYHNYSDI